MIKRKIAFLGLGACGSNIALLFQKRGYTAWFLNGSNQDLRALGNANNILRLKGFDGCAGDRDRAIQALANNLDVLEEIKKIKEEIIYLVFSTAGSTGSGLAGVLCDVLTEMKETEGFDKTICCIAVLPRKEEALQKQINAYNCIKELAGKTEIGSCILVDNSKENSLEKINQILVNQLHAFFCDNSYSTKGNLDVAERLKMIKEPGMCLVSVMNNEQLSVSEYIDRLLVKNIYAPIERDGIIEGIAVVNAGESNVDTEAIIREVGVPQNVFLGFNGKKTITILSGMSFPRSYLNEVKESAERIFEQRMLNRGKVGGRLEDLEFVVTPIAEETPVKRKVNRLEMLKSIQGGHAK